MFRIEIGPLERFFERGSVPEPGRRVQVNSARGEKDFPAHAPGPLPREGAALSYQQSVLVAARQAATSWVLAMVPHSMLCTDF